MGIELTIFFLFLKTFPKWKRSFKDAQVNHPFVLGRMFEANRITFAPINTVFIFNDSADFLPQMYRRSAMHYFLIWIVILQKNVPSVTIRTVNTLGFSLCLFMLWLLKLLRSMSCSCNSVIQQPGLPLFSMYMLYFFLIGDYQAIRKAPLHVGNRSLYLQRGFVSKFPFHLK